MQIVCEKNPAGYVIVKNGRPIKTPAGVDVQLPTSTLAEAIADEWRAQGDKVKPETMPLMQLAATSIDIISKKRDEIIVSLAAYAGSDLLCHRAEDPPELVKRQMTLWQPWLDWAEKKYAVSLKIGTGIMPIRQSPEALEAFRTVVAAYDNFYLAGLQQVVGITGGLILCLVLVEGAATIEQIFNAAELETLFQVEQWGEDSVTTDRHASLKKELGQCALWFEELRRPNV